MTPTTLSSVMNVELLAWTFCTFVLFSNTKGKKVDKCILLFFRAGVVFNGVLLLPCV